MNRNSRSGFTIIELLIFSAIFALVTISFLSVLVAVVRVQSRQGASTDVNQQSDFVLATVQRLVEQSSQIEGTANTAVTDITLRMASSSQDPSRLYLSNGTIYLQQAGGTPLPLTTSQVQVTSASFIKRSNAGGKDGLAVNMTIANASASSTKNVARALDVFVARVSAATFDSDVIPSTTNLKLGVNANAWSSVNDLMYFYSSNVGIGVTNPASKLEVDGGVRINANGASKPTCASGIRGTVWVTQASGGSNDVIEACLRNASSSYNWTAL